MKVERAGMDSVLTGYEIVVKLTREEAELLIDFIDTFEPIDAGDRFANALDAVLTEMSE